MIVEVGNVLCRVLGASDEESRWLQRYLSFEEAGWAGKGRGRRISMYSSINKTFPGGLLGLVKDSAARDQVKLELMDRRVPRLTRDFTADLSWLRDYQRAALEACAKEKRGIVRAPTGSGKTEVIVGLTRALPGRWMFVVHRETLVTQTAERYKLRTGLDARVMSRTSPATWKLEPGLNLMTLQSLANGIRRDKEAVDRAMQALDGLLVDECHVAPADVYFNAVQRCPAEYRFGFSGTPLDRTDNRSLMAIAALGRVVYSIKATDLIAAGVLAMPRITMVPLRQQVGLSVNKRDFHEVYDALVCSPERNAEIVRLAKSAPKPCMVFVKLILHGKQLAQALRAEGLSTEFVWGSTKPEVRSESLKRLDRGDSEVLVASVVFQEGVDIPALRSVVVASGGKSVIAALQRIGRGMRTDEGRKQTFDVLDVLDQGSLMLEKHSRKRMNTYVREGYSVVVREGSGDVPYAPKLLTRAELRERRTRRAKRTA